MAVGYVFTPQTTADEYHKISREATNVQRPEGMLIHAAGADEDGNWHILEVWEDESHADKFGEQVMIPLLRRHGIDPSLSSRRKIQVENLIHR